MAFEFTEDYTVEGAPGGFAICQNGMAINTPSGAPLVVPTAALAETIADEAMRAKANKRDPFRMPIMLMALTAIDVIAASKQDVIDELMTYTESELLCHRAEERGLAREQEKKWQPVLDWFAQRFKATLKSTTGVMPIEQSPESIKAIHTLLGRCSEFLLVGLSQAVSASGSLVLGLGMAVVYINAEQVFQLAELEASHQMESWGEDDEARARREAIKQELKICGQWFNALSSKARDRSSEAYQP